MIGEGAFGAHCGGCVKPNVIACGCEVPCAPCGAGGWRLYVRFVAKLVPIRMILIPSSVVRLHSIVPVCSNVTSS